MNVLMAAALAVAAVAGVGAGFSRPAPPGTSPHLAAPQRTPTRLALGGEAAVTLAGLPRRDAVELRPEFRVDATADVTSAIRLRGELLVAALASRRDGRDELDVLVRPDEAWIEFAGGRADLRAGYGAVVWGRLDELQPTDVINPIDTSRFLLDGRSAARLPVGFVRGRVFGPSGLAVEGVLVPWFRRSTFDELDEVSSPFNLLRDQVVPAGSAGPVTHEFVEHREPDSGWSSMSGGARASVTIGRADLSLAAYRGFDGFGAVAFVPTLAQGGDQPSISGPPGLAIPGRLVEHHERFTMVGGDVEAVAGEWVLRGEVAAFVEKTLAGVSRPGLVEGRVVEAGGGIERRVGAFRAYGLALVRRQWSDEDAALAQTDTSLVGSLERSFARDRYLVRVFGLANPDDRSGFVRGLFRWDARDNVTVDASAALFLGDGDDLVSRFSDRDFLFLRVGYYF